MKISSPEFLESVESLYPVKYPEQFKEMCARLRNAEVQDNGGGGQFIVNIETFWAVNMRVGEEQWGDYERAIAGKLHPKDKNVLWGGILPFYFSDCDIFGFSTDGGMGNEVQVWSVHTIVHSYPSLSEFVKAHLLIRPATGGHKSAARL